MAAKSQITSMYRIQFWSGFKFSDLLPLIPFLKKMGVDSIYSSPILKSTTGSTHGYDVTDFQQVNKELGGENDLVKLSHDVHNEGMKWIQDIVPNHMAANAENVYMQDIFAHGRKSFYWNFFDFMITPEFHYRIDLFILGHPYEEVLNSGNIKIINPENPAIKVYDQEYAISGNGLAMLKTLAGGNITGDSLEKINSVPEMIHSILLRQNYSLIYWKSGLEGTNYRRFFSVNSLIGVHSENTKYFAVLTQKLFSLFRQGIIDGFRLDHIDGLYSPGNFLLRFARGTGNAHVWVEKVLTGNEKLRDEWKTDGTTGYDFLFYCSYLFVHGPSSKSLKKFYKLFTGVRKSPEKMTYENKKYYIKNSFSHEVDYLAYIFYDHLQEKIYGQDLTYDKTRAFMEELLSSFSIYRPYLSAGSIGKADMAIIQDAINLAGERTGLQDVRECMNRMLDSAFMDGRSLYCFQRLQQFIPATIAKSTEDRLFFQYNLLIALDEVGCTPQKFSISRKSFHGFMKYRARHSPQAMNTLSTHDTKLGEDIRARIASISHMEDIWIQSVQEWHELNLKYKLLEGKSEYPTRNHEYYLYQILLAEDPETWNSGTRFKDRIHGQMVKAVREDGTMTDWNNPNVGYEDHLSGFIDRIMKSEDFRKSFGKFYKKVQFRGMLISASENIIKLTAPGIPDIYQGSEVMNLNFTDPDNRGNVDYRRSENLLEKALKMQGNGDYNGIKNSWTDGTLKVFINYILLNFRKNNPDLFLSGDYEVIETTGARESGIISYSRRKGKKMIIVTVPIKAGKMAELDFAGDAEAWKDTEIRIPHVTSGRYKDIFTGKIFSTGDSLRVGEMFSQFPFSVMLWEGDSPA